MQNLIRNILVVGCLFIPALSYAEDNMLVDVNVLYSVPDAGGSDKFHTGKILSVNYNYYFKSWLAATTGVFISEEISTDPATDVVGTYQATIDTWGVTFGVRAEYLSSNRNKVYARAGLLHYETELTVDEFFAPGLIEGSSTSKADGLGYFAALAWAHSFNKQVSLQLELSTMTQLDLFKGETTRPFDLTNTGFSIGLGYAF